MVSLNVLNKSIVYRTRYGMQLCADSINILRDLPSSSVDLVITSPPFALLGKKEYGNLNQQDYPKWICNFGWEVRRVLKDTGSFVLDLGHAYLSGVPARSLYNYRTLIYLCDVLGFYLAHEFFLYNSTTIPGPAEWVTVRRIRVKGAVNTVWWLSKTEWPKADNRKILVPYSKSMLKYFERGREEGISPSGHHVGKGLSRDNGGSIPSNLLDISGSDSASFYHRISRELKIKRHPARFQKEFVEFFLKYLTDPKGRVLDIFSGSNTTGYVAERLKRRWISVDIRRDYAARSVIRFLEKVPVKTIGKIVSGLEAGRKIDLRRF